MWSRLLSIVSGILHRSRVDKDAAHAARGLAWFDWLRQDVRHTARMLRRSPMFAAGAVLSLSLGIGANAALFSLVDALLLRSLPVPDPDRLVSVSRTDALGKRVPVDAAALDALDADPSAFAGATVSVVQPEASILVDGVEEPPRTVTRVTPAFLRVLGLAPLIGTSDISPPAAILSHRYASARFGLSTGVLGRVIVIDGQRYPIAAVAPAGFTGVSLDASVDVWIVPAQRSVPAAEALARLRPGVTLRAAAAAAGAMFERIDAETGEATSPAPRLEVTPAGRGSSMLREPYRVPLLALMALVVAIFLITCANVGSLLALRNAGRVHELTLRAAIGAARSRLMSQLIVEAATLAALGGVGAWIVGRWGVSLLLSTLPVASVPAPLQFQTNGRMLVLLGAAALASVVLSGLMPAWRATRIDLAAALKPSSSNAGGRGAAGGGRWLLVAQIALSVVLLTAAAMFFRTVRNVTQFDLGFDPDRLLQVELSRRARDGRGDVRAVQERLLSALAALPGVARVTAFNASVFPAYYIGVPRPDEPFGGSVGPEFFETLRIPLLRGRLPTADDITRPQAVAVVNESYEREVLDGDAVGKRIQNGSFDLEIVGVVGDARLHNVRWTAPMLYRVGLREPRMMTSVQIRTIANPAAVAPSVEAVVRSVVPGLLLSVRTMDDIVLRSIARERLVATTSACFAGLAVVLAVVGLFAVTAFSVTARTSELGLRMAIGAAPGDVIRDALGDSARLAAAGVIVGAAAAMALARTAEGWIADLVFGLQPTDATNVALAAALMTLAFAAACLAPALRAVRIDPLRALRHD